MSSFLLRTPQAWDLNHAASLISRCLVRNETWSLFVWRPCDEIEKGQFVRGQKTPENKRACLLLMTPFPRIPSERRFNLERRFQASRVARRLATIWLEEDAILNLRNSRNVRCLEVSIRRRTRGALSEDEVVLKKIGLQKKNNYTVLSGLYWCVTVV